MTASIPVVEDKQVLEPIVEEKEELPEPEVESVSTDSDIITEEMIPDVLPERKISAVKEEVDKIMNYETVKLQSKMHGDLKVTREECRDLDEGSATKNVAE